MAARYWKPLESDLIATLAFCQQRLLSDERNGSSGQTDPLLNVSFGQAECEQDGSGALFSLSAAAMTNSGALPHCPPPHQVKFRRVAASAQKKAIALLLPDTPCCSFRRSPSSLSYSLCFFSFFLRPAPSPLLKRPHTLPRRRISSLRSLPAEIPPPGVRSGVIYHGRLRGELTSARAFGAAVVIDSPCLFSRTPAAITVSGHLSAIYYPSHREREGRPVRYHSASAKHKIGDVTGHREMAGFHRVNTNRSRPSSPLFFLPHLPPSFPFLPSSPWHNKGCLQIIALKPRNPLQLGLEN